MALLMLFFLNSPTGKFEHYIYNPLDCHFTVHENNFKFNISIVSHSFTSTICITEIKLRKCVNVLMYTSWY